MSQACDEARGAWKHMMACAAQYANNELSAAKILALHHKYLNASRSQGRLQKHTLQVLHTYVHTKNRALADMQFVGTLNKRGMYATENL